MNKSRFLGGAGALLAMLLCLAAIAPAQVPTVNDFDQLSWHWVGPVTFSGRITEFAVPRGQTTTWYALAGSGGIWKTVDAGISFEPIFDTYGNMSMGYLAIAPSNPDILYLGTGEPMHARSSSHGNGVWKSTDAGKTWTNVGLTKSYFINKVAVHPKNPDLVYVAAEGKLYDNEMDCERGLYKTTDGGKTWTRMGILPDRGISDFVVDPNNFDIIIAGAYKLYRRTWTYIDRQPGNDLYKSTDGGKTWTKLTKGLPVGKELGKTGLAIYEKNPNIVYARLDEEMNLGLNLRENAANFNMRSGFYREGGSLAKWKSYKLKPEMAKDLKWTHPEAENDQALLAKLNELIRDKEFLTKSGIDLAKLTASARKAYAKDKDLLSAIDDFEASEKVPESDETKGRYQARNRFALAMLYGDLLAPQAPAKRAGYIYRSDDQGETWKRMTENRGAQVNQTEGGYYGRIYVDQTNDKIIYCCDTNVTFSTDAGKTFAVAQWDRGEHSLHVDHRGLWVDPENGKHILSANDGGAGETWDGGKHWHQKSTISAQQFYDIAADNEMPYNVMGGTQDNGAWIGPSQNRNRKGVYAADWTYLPTGDGFYVVRDWWNPEYIYYESQFGSSSRQNLKTGERISLAKRTTPEEAAAGVPAQRYQWNAPIVLSPHNPGIVYITSQFVHRSLSRGEPGSWQTISPDLSRNDPVRQAESKKTNLQYGTIYSFAESVVKPGLYWAGTDDGNVWVTTDGGVNWNNITAQFYDMKTGKAKPNVKGALIPFDRWVKRVVPSRFDEKTCYAAFSGYRTHNEDKTWIFVTRDLGKTWEDISAGMENPVWDLEEDPDNPDVLYIGTDYGVFVTIDRGKSWVPFSTSAPDVIIRDLAVQQRDRDLVIGTYGRGIYIADIAPLKEFKTALFGKDSHLFDVEDTVRWNRLEQRGEDYGVFAKVTNPNIGANLYYYLKADVKNVKLTIKDLEGNVVQELSGDAKKGFHKAFWNLSLRAASGQARPAMGGRMGFGRQADNGTYKVTLSIDGKDVETKKLNILPDPLFK
ncbi:MAG: hypothetical protein JW843_01780 [Candidatus Aminicenantes bacterium]|nr:hypothetical protein [Candidatus Aminicenantes bacterium]